MTDLLDITFAALDAKPAQTVVLLAGPDVALGTIGRQLNDKAQGKLIKAAAAADFKARARSTIEILAPDRLDITRLVVIGIGTGSDLKELDWVGLGGLAFAQITARKGADATIVAEVPAAEEAPSELAAMLAYGALLRSYTFNKYRSRPEDETNGNSEPLRRLASLQILCADPNAAKVAFERLRPVAEGVFLARDLVNEPANALGPVEFAERVQPLTRLGLEIEVHGQDELEKLGMGALLGVAQGSDRPPRVIVMQWHGAKSKKAKPICFVGKGVVFDTGGISIKPAGGMEDMKGDMAGGACVAGLMQALAGRKAQVNAIGLIGLVENMPSGKAQRPGDIVKAMSGQTIEVHNTDAEGRLVLADVVWYAQERFKPRFIVDLATLTGAIIVALGKEYAGLFSNDDRLAAELFEAGTVTGEKVWRMPLAKAYDKLIDSKTADMKNIGGRYGGAITGAQFIQRFIKDTPWAHLDIAGTGMDTTRSDINQSWGGGWGVRLLDRLVADKYEKGEKPGR
ncbi:MAG: leucyl aminopeptidase [Hyphomicrobiaceae bacterium]